MSVCVCGGGGGGGELYREIETRGGKLERKVLSGWRVQILNDTYARVDFEERS